MADAGHDLEFVAHRVSVTQQLEEPIDQLLRHPAGIRSARSRGGRERPVGTREPRGERRPTGSRTSGSVHEDRDRALADLLHPNRGARTIEFEHTF